MLVPGGVRCGQVPFQKPLSSRLLRAGWGSSPPAPRPLVQHLCVAEHVWKPARAHLEIVLAVPAPAVLSLLPFQDGSIQLCSREQGCAFLRPIPTGCCV